MAHHRLERFETDFIRNLVRMMRERERERDGTRGLLETGLATSRIDDDHVMVHLPDPWLFVVSDEASFHCYILP